MKEEILKEIKKECNWWERILVRLCENKCIELYKNGVKKGYKWNV